METLEPARPERKTSTVVATLGKMTLRVSSLNASRIVQDDSTGAVYLEVIAASMEQMVIGSMEPKEGLVIEDMMDHYKDPQEPAVRWAEPSPLNPKRKPTIGWTFTNTNIPNIRH